jgi:hypothetical protein
MPNRSTSTTESITVSHSTSGSVPDTTPTPDVKILPDDIRSLLRPITSSATHISLESALSRTDELQIRKLEVDIIHEVENQGFEDGFEHPAEDLVRQYMDHYPSLTKRWLQQTFLRNYRSSEIIVAILKTIAHFNLSQIDPECKILSVAALSHKNPEVREAAISVFDAWSTPDAIDYLENYNENKPWLTHYRDKVLQQLKDKYGIRR